MIMMVKQPDGEIAPDRKGQGNTSEGMDQPPKVTGQSGSEHQNSGILSLIPASLLEAGGNKGVAEWAHTRQSPGVRKSQEIFTRGHGRYPIMSSMLS